MRRSEVASAKAAPTLAEVCADSAIVMANEAVPGGGLKVGSGEPKISAVNDADALTGGEGDVLDDTLWVRDGVGD